jgi:hypothetical protein
MAQVREPESNTQAASLESIRKSRQRVGPADGHQGALVEVGVAAGDLHPEVVQAAVAPDAEVDLDPALGLGDAAPVARDARLDLLHVPHEGEIAVQIPYEAGAAHDAVGGLEPRDARAGADAAAPAAARGAGRRVGGGVFPLGGHGGLAHAAAVGVGALHGAGVAGAPGVGGRLATGGFASLGGHFLHPALAFRLLALLHGALAPGDAGHARGGQGHPGDLGWLFVSFDLGPDEQGGQGEDMGGDARGHAPAKALAPQPCPFAEVGVEFLAHGRLSLPACRNPPGPWRPGSRNPPG